MTIKTQDFFGASPNTVLNKPFFHAQDQKAYNVDGGTSIADAWTKRTLNTVLTNQIPGASLVSDSVMLPAGTYYVEGFASYVGAGTSNTIFGLFKDGLKQIQGNTLLTNGIGFFGSVSGIITLSVSGVIDFRYYTGVAQATYGLGYNNNGGSITDTSLPSIYADFKIWQLDAVVTTPVLVSDKLYPLPGNTVVTGNMHGLEYARTGNNQVTIQPGICMDSLNTTLLSKSTAQALTLPTTVNGIYHLFLCDDGSVRFDTDINGANLTAYKIRWIGYVPNNSSGIVKLFVYKAGEIWFYRFTENTINSLTAVPSGIATAISLTSFLPTSRVSEVLYGGICVSANQTFCLSGVSGTSEVTMITNTGGSAGSISEWGFYYTNISLFIPLINGDVYWGLGGAATVSNVQLAIHAVKLIR